MIGVSDRTSEKHFWIHKTLLLSPRILLAPVTLVLHKPLPQTPMNITKVLPPPYLFFLRLKATTQASHFYWEVSPNHPHEFPRMTASVHWLHFRFYCYDIIFCFHWRIYDQKELMVSLEICFSWWPWGDMEPFWYQEISYISTQVVEEGCINVKMGMQRPVGEHQFWRGTRCKTHLLTDSP